MLLAQDLDKRTERATDLWQVWCLAGLLAVVFVGGVLLRPALPIDETRYLSVAWEMHLSGDYFVPTKNGETYAHKPPLLFWLINAVWSVTGVSEVAARLVGPAFAILNLPLTFVLARRLYPDRPDIAPAAAAVLTSLLFYGLYAGLTMFDAMLTAMTLLFLSGAWAALREDRRMGWLVCGLALGLGILAKGPVILLHTLPVLLFSGAWRASNVKLSSVLKGTLSALGIGAVIAAAWLLPALVLGGDAYRDELLWTQTAGRVANAFDHARPAWFFLALLPIYLLPWSLNLDAWRAMGRIELAHPAVRMLVLHVAGALLLFSLIASKQVHYLLPELPALSILLASVLQTRRLRVRSNLAVIGSGLAASGVAIGLFVNGDQWTSIWITDSTLAGAALLLGYAALTVIFLGRRTLFGITLWTLSTFAVLNAWIGASALGRNNDIQEFTRHFAGRDGQDIAYLGKPYNAEFNFIGRLTSPIYDASSLHDVKVWATRHPRGLIVAPVGTLPDAPSVTVTYGRRSFGIWNAEVAVD
ncbi:hypothetical protein EF888_19840 [Silicimonas algicola]|uniref:4-amino-4-deoxy-L-arabinose transferase-like glycosyltransferase n=1 Tax=Silicimonas algicola TaxID=1826607 RepID=A0A316G236_9RHOB|nr:glycosyltransferase family 39 protein [Silicimonas algicola]AZQ69184.1 hypothetical protein EF888_19840 [Silicimonas algicola]PWK55004.1 4-amino-4-deoxy-L-arabinose transferase-like glycosyltransferase [Silicimonas algicola]